MSADNGIYILNTKEGQYRVIHAQAIDNLNWSFIHFREEKYVPTRIIEYYGNCKYTYNKDMAMHIANNIYKWFPFVEYGIQIIPANRTWNQIKNDAINYAKQEIKAIENCNDDGRWDDNLTRLKLLIN
jgi:hypothetical protein